MIWIDWIFIGAIILSAAGSYVRGALREIIALSAWILGAYVAFIYSSQSQSLLEPYIETPEFRYAIVFMTILIIFLVLGAVVGILLSRLINAIGLSSLDKTLGIIFGLVRGLLLIVIFIIAASFTTLTKSDWWPSSLIIAKLQKPADEILTWLEASKFWPKEALKPGSVLEMVPPHQPSTVAPIPTQSAPSSPETAPHTDAESKASPAPQPTGSENTAPVTVEPGALMPVTSAQ